MRLQMVGCIGGQERNRVLLSFLFKAESKVSLLAIQSITGADTGAGRTAVA